MPGLQERERARSGDPTLAGRCGAGNQQLARRPTGAAAGGGVVMGRCGDCGDEDGDNYTECCGVWLCDDCLDRHEEKWGSPNEALKVVITTKGRELLEKKNG